MLAPGTVLFDKYRVDRVIGKGGMSVVVRATHLHLDEPVAIKVLLPEMAARPNVIERFLREARAAVRLKGEHVARVTDVGTLAWGQPYMVMEFLDGIDLDHVLKEQRMVPAHDAVDFMMQACEAMAEAHALGIVHRDIKPSNFFVTRRPDGSPLLKVLDFGISKVAIENQESNLTRDAVIGTPAYMAPEQLRGAHDVDARADIWSLGIVLYECLCGRRPFRAESFSALAIKAATEPTPPIPDAHVLPPGLDSVVYRCLAKDLDLRFQSVAELALALAPYAGNPRAAATAVERSIAILRVTPLPFPSPLPPRAPTAPTTLGTSAGSVIVQQPASRGRLGWVVGAGVIAGIAAAVLITTGIGRGGDSRPAASPITPAAPVTMPTIVPPPPPIVTPIETAEPEPPKPETAAVDPAVTLIETTETPTAAADPDPPRAATAAPTAKITKPIKTRRTRPAKSTRPTAKAPRPGRSSQPNPLDSRM